MKKLLALLVLLAAPAFAGDLPVLADYDLDATTRTYCRFENSSGKAVSQDFSTWNRKSGVALTVSTTTVTGTNAFTNIDIGDIIAFNDRNEGWVWRVVVTNADDSTITVETTLTLDNTDGNWLFYWAEPSCGTAATNGWFPVSAGATIWFRIGQMNVTGSIDPNIECRGQAVGTAGGRVQVYPDTHDSSSNSECRKGDITSANACAIQLSDTPPFKECRIGLVIDSADDGSDTGAALEQISAGVILK